MNKAQKELLNYIIGGVVGAILFREYGYEIKLQNKSLDISFHFGDRSLANFVSVLADYQRTKFLPASVWVAHLVGSVLVECEFLESGIELIFDNKTILYTKLKNEDGFSEFDITVVCDVSEGIYDNFDGYILDINCDMDK